MINLLWSGLLTLLLLSGCGSNGSPSRHNDFVPLTSIVITAAKPTIAAGTSTTLTVTGNYSGLFTRDITDQAVWSSASPAVANFITAATPNRVTAGIVTGPVILTANVGGVSSTFSLTVSTATVTSMAIDPVAVLPKGLTSQLKVTGTFSDLSTQDLTFDATWSSSNSAAATVSDATGSKGLATAVAATGFTTISATFPTVGGISGTTTLTVTNPVVVSITVLPANPSILSLSGGNFTATGTYSDGTATPDLTNLVTWSSSVPAVATILSTGAASTLTQGTTAISASIPASGITGQGAVSGATNLKVTGGNLTGITISPSDVTLANNSFARITATGSFNNGTSRDITKAVSWDVANKAIANISKSNGNLAWINSLALTGGVGSTITSITATSGNVNASANLTVDSHSPSSLTFIFPANFVDLTVGTSARFISNGNFNTGALVRDVTASSLWTSSDGTVATVINTAENTPDLAKGRLFGVTAGTVTVTATYAGLTNTTSVIKITQRTLSNLNISGSSNVKTGSQAAFTATAVYTDGTSKDVTEDTAWAIDKTSVAIFADSTNQPGQVVGVDSGTAIISATFGGLTKTMSFTTVP